jgi:protein-S-isoprenylcysteine O-methyltransferase Ste14
MIVIILGIFLPKSEDTFDGIIITYIGFTLLNGYPFLFLIKPHRVILLIVSVLFTGVIVYGWSTIISTSGGGAPGFVKFIGAILIMFSISGILLSAYELLKKASSDGAFSEELYKNGMYTLVRHPQVMFSILLIFGLILFFWCPALTWTMPLWIIGFISYAAFEEKFELLHRFDNEYLEYCKQIPALIPDKKSIKKCIDSFS